jgi:hypothetical protein
MAALVLLGGVYALGTASADTPADVLKKGLAHCAAISGPDERLACYDALASQGPASLDRAAQSARPPVPPPSPPAAAAESDTPEEFGLSPAQKAPPKTSSITARVVGFTRNKDGAVVVNLDNGQSWALDEPDPLLASGDSVTIRRATLGSFVLTTPTHRTHRAHRTQ